MNIAFDIGGVISKFPNQFKEMAKVFMDSGHEVFVITDMHDRAEVLKTLDDNGFGFIKSANIHCADYTGIGEFCKAVLLKKLNIDIFLDDFVGYMVWDSSLGPAPIRLLVCPDGFKPYWHKDWKVQQGHDFGRRATSMDMLKA